MRAKIVYPFLLLLTALLLLYVRSEPKKSTPFCLDAIAAHLPHHPEWECRSLSGDEEQQILAALSQPYRYLGSGGQCYAFLSEDDQYVIKFFKQKAFAPLNWMHYFPRWLKHKQIMKMEIKRNRVFEAFRLSFDLLPEETGMLYVHLNPTTHLNKLLKVCDATGKSHLLNLDGLEFALQKKAELAFVKIDSLMQKKDVGGAKEAIHKLLQINMTLDRKGIFNRDPNFGSNCGFIGTNPILIDVGRVIHNEEIKEPEKSKKQLLKAIASFRQYLAQNHSELIDYFDQCNNEVLQVEIQN